MKVKDLLDWTVWRAGSSYDRALETKLSVFLPTFRRGRDGLFLRVARSILSQTLIDLELIIIDDASTDGTADIIDALMAEDGRVSCLTHKKNIGLPAVSEYEAFVRSRGRYIAFAFDDFLFEHTAFERMVNAMEDKKLDAAFGKVSLHIDAGLEIVLGGNANLDRLSQDNFIGNASVVLTRSVVESVGFYDPHVALTRVCDWDLWRRVKRKYALTQLDITVGRELGASRSDSLGNTYPMHPEAIQEFMADDRDRLLLPETFLERDVLAMPAFASVPLQTHVKLTRRYFEKKYWHKEPEDLGHEAPRKVISIYNDLSVNSQLTWMPLKNTPTLHVNWVADNTSHFHQDSLLARSDLVVLSGDLAQHSNVAAILFCQKLGIPIAYYVDERSPLLGRLHCVSKRSSQKSDGTQLEDRASNFEEVWSGLVVKGWAFEKNDLRSHVEISMDGEFLGCMEASINRPDLGEAGFGDGKHGFLYPVPENKLDGGEHEITLNWASDKTPLGGSPLRVNLPTYSEVKDRRASQLRDFARLYEVDVQSLDVQSVAEALSPFAAIIAASKEVERVVLKVSPPDVVRTSNFVFDQALLARQDTVRGRAGKIAGPIKIAVMHEKFSGNVRESAAVAAIHALGPLGAVRFDQDLHADNLMSTALTPSSSAKDFGAKLDYWSSWAPDIAVLQVDEAIRDFELDALLMLCGYIGAVPIVPQFAHLSSWPEDSGVYRAADTTGGWGSCLEQLASAKIRTQKIQRLREVCIDRFRSERLQETVTELLNHIPPADLMTLSERYRAGWLQRALR